MTTGKLARAISPDLIIAIPNALNHDRDLHQAVQRALGRIHNLALKPYQEDRGASYEDEVKKSIPLKKLAVEIGGKANFNIKWDHSAINQSFVAFDQDEHARTMKRKISKQSISALSIQSLENLDESYELTVPDGSGQATIKAKNALGALRGLATFTQMIYELPSGSTKFVFNLPLAIQDKPAFPYRGICECPPLQDRYKLH